MIISLPFFSRQSSYHNNGFLLIELLVGLFFIVSSFLVIARYQAICALWQREAIERMQAIDAASSCIDMIASGQLSTASGVQQVGQFSLAWRVQPVAGQVASLGIGSDVRMIDARVNWVSPQGKTRTVQLISTIFIPTKGRTHVKT